MGASKNYSTANDRIIVNDYGQIQDLFSSGGTVSFWMNIRSEGIANTTSRFLFKWFDGNNGWQVLNNNDLKTFFSQAWSTTNYEGIMDGVYPSNAWIHVAITYNSDSTSNNSLTYLDGEIVPTSTVTPSGTLGTDAGTDLYIGNHSNTFHTTDGFLSYIQLFNRILSQPEIKEIMHKPGSIRNGLVGFWPLTDDGSTQRNLSGIGNTGAVTGATNSTDGPPVTCFK